MLRPDVRGRVALVTGGSSGVGRAIARALLRAGDTVIVPSRNPDAVKPALVETVTEDPGARLLSLRADLSRLEDVRRLSEEIRSRYDRLDVLSATAGVLLPRRRETVDGLETTFVVGFLSHFLLVNRLAALMQASEHARVLLVAGIPAMIARAPLNLDDLQLEQRYSAPRAALQTAAAKVLFARELARRDTRLAAYPFHPGSVRSNLGRHLPVVIRPFYRLANLFLSERCPVGERLAVAPKPPGPSGQFQSPSGPVDFGFRGIPPDAGPALWDSAEELCGERL